jgi:RluA family pseudouridine synthase
MSATIRLSADWPELEILHEDDLLLAVNKPPGLLIAPDRWDKNRPNLMTLLQTAIRDGQPWTRERHLTYLANVHRLDIGTSGVLLLAKTRETLVHLAQQFFHHTPEKHYLALTEGILPGPELLIDQPIGQNPHQPGKCRIDPRNGKPAQTRIQLLERFRHHSLVDAELLTGRQHQVRVHLQFTGCPLIADPDYGSGKPLLLSQIKPGYKATAHGERPLIGRPALHAWRLKVQHPGTGATIAIEAPAPDDFILALKYLRRFAASPQVPRP